MWRKLHVYTYTYRQIPKSVSKRSYERQIRFDSRWIFCWGASPYTICWYRRNHIIFHKFVEKQIWLRKNSSCSSIFVCSTSGYGSQNIYVRRDGYSKICQWWYSEYHWEENLRANRNISLVIEGLPYSWVLVELQSKPSRRTLYAGAIWF